MKRALAIAVALCTLGFAGFSQIAIKGSWTASVCLVPSTTLTSTLNLTYTVAGFDITSITGFGAAGITSQRFTFKGVFGPFSASGNVWFQPSPAAYLAADAVTSFDFGGIAIGATVRHWTPGNFRTTEWAPDSDPCATQTPPGVGYLQYIFTGTISPLSIRARFADCCTGASFQDLRISLTGVDLCCGIKYNAVVDFTKAGFQSLTLSGINIPLCCGVSFDLSITYSVAAKSVTFTPKFAGIAEACFTVWGGPVSGATTNIWEGLRIDGFRIRCTIADCNYLEYVHAFAPTAGTIPSAIRAKFLAACQENEYLELGFCGAGCCGGKYEVSLRILWSTTLTNPGLFGVTRFVGSAKIPVMANFTLNLDFVMPAAACASASFCFGWTFTF
ncbi:MAG: hypothetical protein N2320_02005 [Candidatus Bipolaricaulota bacterium]|nr:hypothetical protein [Candidatus Bipolaricaulota bacterium]